MDRIKHVVKDESFLVKAIERGFRYYRTVCGTTALLAQLYPETSLDEVDCGACLSLVSARVKAAASTSQGSAMPQVAPTSRVEDMVEGLDLDDFDEVDAEAEAEESRSSQQPASSQPPAASRQQGFAAPSGQQPAASSQHGFAAPYPGPDELSYTEICARLGKDPSTDPQGKLGNLDVDVRVVLTESERAAADSILGMVGTIPMAAPLVHTVYRICHRLAWLENSRQPPAASRQHGSAEIGEE